MNKKIRLSKILNIFIILSLMLSFVSCKKTQTYAEMLEQEEESIQKFLESGGRYTAAIPSDISQIAASGNRDEISSSVPFYELPNGVYMQVIDKGNGRKIKEGERVIFRFLRINLNTWAAYPYTIKMFDVNKGGTGNFYYTNVDDFYFDYSPNYSISLSPYYTYGLGIEYPLPHLSDRAKVYCVIPSKVGFAESVSSVVPYLYYIEYSLSKQ